MWQPHALLTQMLQHGVGVEFVGRGYHGLYLLRIGMAREGTSLILVILQTEQQLLCPHPEGIDLTQYTDLLCRHRKPALHAVLFWLNQ